MKRVLVILLIGSLTNLYSMEITKETFTDRHKTFFKNSLDNIIKKGRKLGASEESGILAAALSLKNVDFEDTIITDSTSMQHLNDIKTKTNGDDDKLKEVYKAKFPYLYIGKSYTSFIHKNERKDTRSCTEPLATLLLYSSIIE